jgi:restriction endonuclease S subunit
MLPKIEEQLKIAQFFEKLDELVVLHQRKFNLYLILIIPLG